MLPLGTLQHPCPRPGLTPFQAVLPHPLGPLRHLCDLRGRLLLQDLWPLPQLPAVQTRGPLPLDSAQSLNGSLAPRTRALPTDRQEPKFRKRPVF